MFDSTADALLAPTRHRRHPVRRPFILIIVAGLLALGVACTAEPEDDAGTGVTVATPTTTVEGTVITVENTPAAVTPASTQGRSGTAPEDAPLYDPTLIRDDVDCTLEFIASGGGEEFADGFTSGHFVVDGVLGEPCLGEDPRLLRAWEWLRTIAAPSDLDGLILLAGFDAPSELLAYVEALTTGEGEVAFQMTVNLGEAERDDVELALTMAHELTHVFTGLPEQLDRGVDESQCHTYHEGEGCYLAGSYIHRWIEAFWGEWIANFDPLADDEGAYDRCFLDPSFLGSYAATNPEEDFAETFSAYVFSVPVDDPGLLAKYEFFAADPYLSAFKARAVDAGVDPLPNQFEGCGF